MAAISVGVRTWDVHVVCSQSVLNGTEPSNHNAKSCGPKLSYIELDTGVHEG
jgi:hypothetical protein